MKLRLDFGHRSDFFCHKLHNCLELTQKCPVKTQDMNIIEAQDMNVIDVEDEKREKRLERDRMNARERRKRRKLHVFALEKSQARLNIENIRLQRENNVLRENVIAVSQEVSNLRDLCAMLQTSATGMTSGAETMVCTIFNTKIRSKTLSRSFP